MEIASLLSAAATARAESIRMEQDWEKLEPFRVNKLATPGSIAAVKEIAKLLSERTFRHTARSASNGSKASSFPASLG